MFNDFTNRPVALSDTAFKTKYLELLQCVTKCTQLNAVASKEYSVRLYFGVNRQE